MIGFKRVYKAISLLLPYPQNLFDTELIKEVATVMYVLGGLDAFGVMDGARSSVQVVAKVREFQEREKVKDKTSEKKKDDKNAS